MQIITIQFTNMVGNMRVAFLHLVAFKRQMINGSCFRMPNKLERNRDNVEIQFVVDIFFRSSVVLVCCIKKHLAHNLYMEMCEKRNEDTKFLARNWIRSNCMPTSQPDCLTASLYTCTGTKSLLPYTNTSWRLQINCYIAKHNKWKYCSWLYAKLSIHRGNIMELNHGAHFFCTFASGISHISVVLPHKIPNSCERIWKIERERKTTR